MCLQLQTLFNFIYAKQSKICSIPGVGHWVISVEQHWSLNYHITYFIFGKQKFNFNQHHYHFIRDSMFNRWSNITKNHIYVNTSDCQADKYSFVTFLSIGSLWLKKLKSSNAYLWLVHRIVHQKEAHLCTYRFVRLHCCTHRRCHICHMTKKTAPHTDTAVLHLSLDSTLLRKFQFQP